MNNLKRLLPAYPLFVKDPYFSIWSDNEILNKSDCIFWNGEKKYIYGILELDGIPFSFLGNNESIQNIEQTSLSVSLYTTDYSFENEYAKLSVSFVSPLLLSDMELLSCPVCYMKYNISLKKAKQAKLSIYINGNICYNDIPEDNCNKVFRGDVFDLGDFKVAWTGLVRQAPLSYAADNEQADWGYFYLSGENAYVKDNVEYSFPKHSSDRYIISENTLLEGNIMLGYDDIVSINYFGDFLRGYYLRANKTIIDALKGTYSSINQIDEKLKEDDNRIKRLSQSVCESYYNLLCGSLRQAIGAHKLVEDRDGNILFLSKECCSNGCIATVDVTYPSMPLFLLYNPEYVKGMLRPVFKFAKMPIWKYDFAPHDVGTYPVVCGQVYGLKNECIKRVGNLSSQADLYKFPSNYDLYEYESQMPIEECANMLIAVYSCYYYDKDLSLINDNLSLLDKWVRYLIEFGLRPQNQLCTDDFAGHLKNNVNLTIKAAVAIKCYSFILKLLGKDNTFYEQKIVEFKNDIEEFSKKNNHLPLTWDSDNTTFSLKYNFAFDKLLNLNIFSQDVLDREIDCYLSKQNKYGVPLDNRKMYTKSDWQIWSATLSEDKQKIEKIVDGVNEFLLSSPHRFPFGDWFDTITGERHVYHGYYQDRDISFINRSVQGGIFILLLKNMKK